MKLGDYIKSKMLHYSIRKRMLIILLSMSISIVLLMTLVFSYGIFGLRNFALETGREIGKTSAENSRAALEEEAKDFLLLYALNGSEKIHNYLDVIQSHTEMIGRAMTNIMSNPSRYNPIAINEEIIQDNDQNTLLITTWYQEDAGRSNPQLQYELMQTNNVIPLIKEIAREISPSVTSSAVCIASKTGFMLMAETDSKDYIENELEYELENNFVFNFKDRPWYNQAINEDRLIFTEVFADKVSGNLGMSCAIPYKANEEIAGVAMIGNNFSDIEPEIFKAQIKYDGFCFILDDKGRILISQKQEGIFASDKYLSVDLRTLGKVELTNVVEQMLSGKSDVVKINLDDEEYFLAFAPIAESGWSYAAVAKVSKVLEKAEKSSLNISALALERVSNLASHIKITMFFLIASIVLIFLMATKISQKISNGFVKPLHILTDGVREIANGNFDKKLDIRTNDELEHLADSFNVMTDELKTYMDNLTKMTADKERIATELNVATNIQISMLPRNFNFNRDDFEIYATMHAAKEVGGDFYDFYLLDENHLMITIADVSGKGVPAALFMANSKTILKNFAMTMTNPDDLSAVMKLANDQLCQG
ncbi:MAG: HAMP domain-containing protein, partial [Selenomonadaceae bacterium]|nr:HAMP domain-containing protein [Selenomonadaceae bacterium]